MKTDTSQAAKQVRDKASLFIKRVTVKLDTEAGWGSKQKFVLGLSLWTDLSGCARDSIQSGNIVFTAVFIQKIAAQTTRQCKVLHHLDTAAARSDLASMQGPITPHSALH